MMDANTNKIADLLYAIADSQDESSAQKLLFERLLRQTDKLIIKPKNKFSLEIIDEAINLTRMAICGCDYTKKINGNLIRKLCYSHQQPEILEKRYLNTFYKIFKNKIFWILKHQKHDLSIDSKIKAYSIETFADFISDSRLSGLDLLLADEFTDHLIKLIDYIINDGAELKRCHVRNKLDCNAQILIIERIFNHQPWGKIAEKLNVSKGTITGRFFYLKCLPLLQEIAGKFEVI
ncbi:MAG TPA: hypothetical protein V6C58_03305 [Allocoleopsis sp.]